MKLFGFAFFQHDDTFLFGGILNILQYICVTAAIKIS
jgi:hypothetical protein